MEDSSSDKISSSLARARWGLLKEHSIGVWVRILRVYTVISNEIRKKVGRKGLTLPQLYALTTLGLHGEMLLGKLGKELMVTKGNITTIVDHLERSGFVIREPDKNDRRKIWVRLTSKGEQFFEEVLSAYEEEFVPLMRCLSQDELKQLSLLLKKITEGIPVYGKIRSDNES
ncbi:MAG: MarR family transcriptional regulator [Desulfobacterota bacterium]|nr:MarR family transcriptional regulator [Thermodesulfobacteriota bacterium]